MNKEDNAGFDLDCWLGGFEGCTSEKMSEDNWTEFLNAELAKGSAEPDCLTESDYMSEELTEEEWRDYAYFPREDRYTEKNYLIGYYDMGVFNEITVRACNEELAIDGFLCDYQPKGRYAPYIARCETMIRAEGRIAAGYTDLPEDGQTDRFESFGNKYYEALHN